MRLIVVKPVVILTIFTGTFLAFSTSSCFSNPLLNSPKWYGYRGNDTFGIYTVRLDGSGFKSIHNDPKRATTHPRVSPDSKWITFTRFNRIGKDGLAKEDGINYNNTEIMLIKSDGTGLRTIVKANPKTMAANSSWADNGRSLIYISTNNKKHVPEVVKIDIDTGKSTKIPTPKGLVVADPHIVESKIVFPVLVPKPLLFSKNEFNHLGLMNVNGKNYIDLTTPHITPESNNIKLRLGDYDPWISPDGKEVAFMRHYGGDYWKIFKVDTKSREETLLADDKQMNAVPKWSPDGKKIVYSHINREKLKSCGLYIMNSDGTNKKQIPTPRGYLYMHPAFFPNDASGKQARIIYYARRVPAFP